MQVWNVLHAARWKYRTQKIAKNSPSAHRRTTCRDASSQPRHVSIIGKKLSNSNSSSTCPHNMVNFGQLTAGIGSGAWCTPANFNGFRVLAALLHGTLVLGVSQTLRRWKRAPLIFGRAAIMLGIGPHKLFRSFSVIRRYLRQDHD